MEHSAIRKKDTLTEFFCRSDEVSPTISIYKVNPVTKVISSIPGTYTSVDLGNNHKSCSFTTPNEDCYICIKFGSHPIFIRVGDPLSNLFIFYGVNTSQTLSFRHILASTGAIINSGNLSELDYGFYYYEPSITDLSFIEIQIDGIWESHLFKLPYEHVLSSEAGTIQIEPERWHLLAIPIKYGYWDNTTHKLVHDSITIARIKNYVMDQLEDIYSTPPETLIEVANSYPGDRNAFFNYVPGLTNPTSEHNFPLINIDLDGPYGETAGFWIKSIHDDLLLINWGK